MRGGVKTSGPTVLRPGRRLHAINVVEASVVGPPDVRLRGREPLVLALTVASCSERRCATSRTLSKVIDLPPNLRKEHSKGRLGMRM